MDHIRQAILDIKGTGDLRRVKEVLGSISGLPLRLENLPLFEGGFELIRSVEDPLERRELLLEFVKGIQPTRTFLPLYLKAMEDAVAEADGIPEGQRRITELLKIANGLPRTHEFMDLKVQAWRLALGLPDKPSYRRPDLRMVARELPKEVDVAFYRRYTLLGIAKDVSKTGEFARVYRDAITLAIDAAAYIEEPYYRKYALLFIAHEIKERGELYDLYRRAMEEAYGAALLLKDPFAKEYALIDIFRELPKTPDFYPIIKELLEKALSFFTVRRWMEDVEVTDVVDFILSAEELGIKESKKRRYWREKHAKSISREFEKLVSTLNDIRYIEVLKPYAHVWIQPRSLRDAVKKVLQHLEAMRETYHGREIERPVFIREAHPGAWDSPAKGALTSPRECIAIDLGATNTVVMRKKRGERPDFIRLDPAARLVGGAYLVPTVLSTETNAIGAEVTDEEPIVNIKQLLLDGNPRGGVFMERFLKALCQRMKKTSGAGWLQLFSNLSEVVYVTVPVGYGDYTRALGAITKRVFRGTRVEFIEEPLAAAIGYQVAEKRDKVIMVVDFGGSTLNIMIVRVSVEEVHVISKPERALLLGGYDIDQWLAKHMAERLGMEEGDLPHRLVAKAEEAKIALSVSHEAPFEWNGRDLVVTREEFEEVLEKNDFFRSVDRAVGYVIKKAEKVGLKKEGIEAVLLTGGSSQIPSFRDKIGSLLPGLRLRNLIFDHSPLTAVGEGAALYGTREVVDRHLAVPYALRYATTGKDDLFSYTIVLEKGEPLPLEKTFKLTPAKKLGIQSEVYLELYEVPESIVARRWVKEEGVEFLRQEILETKKADLKNPRTVTIPFEKEIRGDVIATFRVDEKGNLSVRYGAGGTVDTGIRLQ